MTGESVTPANDVDDMRMIVTRKNQNDAKRVEDDIQSVCLWVIIIRAMTVVVTVQRNKCLMREIEHRWVMERVRNRQGHLICQFWNL